jgi:hypothetical protein
MTSTSHDPRDVYRALVGQPTSARRSPFVRLVTDSEFFVRALRYAVGLPTPMYTEDRRILEQVIFPYYRARNDMRTVLFVGCQWYTRHYERAYFPDREYWTIEPDEKARKFGAHQHVVAPWENLDRHFPENHFDLVIANGVYGVGLDTHEQCEAAFAHTYSRLRPGGHLVFGWNDIPERTPVPFATIASLQRFTPLRFPPLDTSQYLTDTPHRHTYAFYTR